MTAAELPFDPAAYGPALAVLLTPPRLPDLGPGVPSDAGRAAVDAWAASPGFGRPVRDTMAAAACVAALYLHFDCWAESHVVAQDLDTPEGSLWHAILHRREPDSFNAKYWFRRAAGHPVLLSLAALEGYGTAAAFVDVCDRVRGTGGEAEAEVRQVQLAEWWAVFDFCANKAVGGQR